MSDEYRRGGMGCGEWLAVLVLLFFGGLFLLGGGDYETTSTETTSNTYAANTELMSRNQANLFSEVENIYYTCNGAGSCTTTTTATTTENTTTTSTNVDGERNVVTLADGTRLCWDASLNTWTSGACNEGGQP